MIKTTHYSISMSVVSPHTTPILPKSSTEHSARDAPPIGYDTRPSCDSTPKEKKSLDLVQKLERKLADYNASQNVFKRWLFEITSWLVSALCMGAVIVICVRISGKEMVHSEKLLILVSLLGKIASAALIIPTSEALGQLKWNWFNNSQAMRDFEIFDKASRGPWGAALLLFRTKGRSLAALGALLIVLLLAIDTFFQQLILYPDQWTLHHTLGEIPRVVFYDPAYLKEYRYNFETSPTDKDLTPIIDEYLYNNGTQPVPFGNGNRPEIPLSCPTSNCTWPTYDTLAVCSKCTEVAELLDITYMCTNTTIDWSGYWYGPLRDIPYPVGIVCGHFLNATTDNPTLLTGYSINKTEHGEIHDEVLLQRNIPLTGFINKVRSHGVGSVAFENIRNPLFDSLVVSAPNGPESVYQGKQPLVTECALFWCVQTIQSSYNLGKYSEEIISEFHNMSTGPSPWESWQIPEEEGGGDFLVYTENITISPPAPSINTREIISNDQFGANNITAANAMAPFDDFFPSAYTAENTSTTRRLVCKYYDDGPSVRTLVSSPWLAPNNVTHHIERLATAITNRIRSSISKEMVTGQAFFTEKYVTVRWGWLTFPLLLLVLSLLFLVSTIIKTSKDNNIWKSSSLPTLIYSLPKETQGQFTNSSTWNSTKETKKVRIRLNPKTGWRVSGQSQLSTSPQLPRPAVQPHHSWI
ncbi:hypothetical protein HRS9122_06817 [Pyrenophora teres f. teres]|nr:hypothetical protein HRS9122_06817 [Pyrenophora teres f. teres]